MSRFLFERSRLFDRESLSLLRKRWYVRQVTDDPFDAAWNAKALEIFQLLEAAAAALYQPVLWDAEHMTYGAPDFLVRSDMLLEMFPGAPSREEARGPSPDLKAPTGHCRVLDAKFTTLRLTAGGLGLENSGSFPACKAQCFIYNRMLGRMQGYEPPASHILGRSAQ